MINVSIPEVNVLKNSSTLAVSVSINIFIKLGFVSVKCPREISKICKHMLNKLLIFVATDGQNAFKTVVAGA